jgi:hypothetical protein
MVTRDAKEYPKTIPSEIQGGRPLHFLRVLSRIPLLEYPPIYMIVYTYSSAFIYDLECNLCTLSE